MFKTYTYICDLRKSNVTDPISAGRHSARNLTDSHINVIVLGSGVGVLAYSSTAQCDIKQAHLLLQPYI